MANGHHHLICQARCQPELRGWPAAVLFSNPGSGKPNGAEAANVRGGVTASMRHAGLFPQHLDPCVPSGRSIEVPQKPSNRPAVDAVNKTLRTEQA